MCRPVYILLLTSTAILSVLVISRQRLVAFADQGHYQDQDQGQYQGQGHSQGQRHDSSRSLTGQGQSLHRKARSVGEYEEVTDDLVPTTSTSPTLRRGRRQRLNKEISNLKASVKKLEGDVTQAITFISGLQRDGKCGNALCPVGSVRFGCQCYMFVLNKKRKWEDAREYCYSMGAHLLVADSDRVSKNVKRFLKANLGKRGMRKVNLYTSLILTSQKSSEPAFMEAHRGSRKAHGWYWQRGVTRRSKPMEPHVDYNYWADGHPITTNATSREEPAGFSPSCMIMNGTDSFKWYSVHCVSENYFICEWEATKLRKSKRQKKKETDVSKSAVKKLRKKRGTRGLDAYSDDGHFEIYTSDDEDDEMDTGLGSRFHRSNVNRDSGFGQSDNDMDSSFGDFEPVSSDTGSKLSKPLHKNAHTSDMSTAVGPPSVNENSYKEYAEVLDSQQTNSAEETDTSIQMSEKEKQKENG